MIHPFYLSLDFAIILHSSQILLGMLMCLHRDIFCKINLRTFKMNEHTSHISLEQQQQMVLIWFIFMHFGGKSQQNK